MICDPTICPEPSLPSRTRLPVSAVDVSPLRRDDCNLRTSSPVVAITRLLPNIGLSRITRLASLSARALALNSSLVGFSSGSGLLERLLSTALILRTVPRSVAALALVSSLVGASSGSPLLERLLSATLILRTVPRSMVAAAEGCIDTDPPLLASGRETVRLKGAIPTVSRPTGRRTDLLKLSLYNLSRGRNPVTGRDPEAGARAYTGLPSRV